MTAHPVVGDNTQVSDTPPDQTVGRLAVNRGYISEAQLAQVQGAGDGRPLIEQLQALGLIDFAQLVELIRATDLPGGSLQPGDDPLLGQMAMDRGYVTTEQLNECFELQARLSDTGTVLTIGQLLIRERYLSPSQLLEILEDQRKHLLKCPGCGATYNVLGYQEGVHLHCKRCRKILVIPSTDHRSSRVQDLTPGGGTDPQALQSLRLALAEGPQELGKYRILQELGRGGMAVVYEAEDMSLGRTVALKILKETGDEGTLTARFQREARTAARLQHPNIVAVHEVGIEKGLHYIAMDRIVGQSLEAILALGSHSRDALVEMLRCVAEAVHTAHLQGIVHRDLKPANILIRDADDTPVVVDFGLARQLDTETHLTQTGSAMGTPFYMPPEQVSGELDQIDGRSDVYALGIVLYEMLTGRLPFHGSSAMEIYSQILETEPERPTRLRAGLPADLEIICIKAIEKQSRHRYDSAALLAEDLQRFLRGETILASPPTLLRVAVRRVKRHRMVSLSLVVGLIVLLAAFVGLRQLRTREYRQVLRRAEARLTEGDYQAAADQFTRALGLRPASAEARAGLERVKRAVALAVFTEARTRLAGGEIAAARTLFQRASRAGPTPEPLAGWITACDRLEEARSLIDLGRWQEAGVTLGSLPVETPLTARLAALSQAGASASAQLEARRYPDAVKTLSALSESHRALPAIGRLWRQAKGIGRITIETVPPGLVVQLAPAGKKLRPFGDGSVPLELGIYQVVVAGTIRFPLAVARDARGFVRDLVVRVPLQHPAGMRLVPAGADLPAFFIDELELTNAAYARFLSATGYAAPPHWKDRRWPRGRGAFPLTNVTRPDAQAYARWAGKQLPSLAQWEKAAKGVDGRSFPWGSQGPSEFQLPRRLREAGTTPVDTSPYGVKDMAGGVSEWTSTNGTEPWVKIAGGCHPAPGAPRISPWAVAETSSATADYKDRVTGFRCVRPVPAWLGKSPTTRFLATFARDARRPTEQRILALGELARHPGPAAQAALRIALRDSDKTIQLETAYRLALTRQAAPIELLHEGIKDAASESLRTACAAAFGLLRDTSTRDALVAALLDDSTHVQDAAARSLWQRNQSDSVALIAPLMVNPRQTVRINALYALGGIRDASTHPLILSATTDKDEGVRGLAAQLAASIPGAATVDRLLPLLRDLVSDVRDNAADSLVQLDPPDVHQRAQRLFSPLDAVTRRTLLRLLAASYSKDGVLAADAYDFDKALKRYNRAIELDSSAELFDKRSGIYLHLGRFAESLPDSLAALKLNPELASAHSKLTVAYTRLRQYEKAQAHSKKALELEVAATHYVCRADLYLEMGQVEMALADYQKALSLETDHDEALYGMAACREKQGKHSEALALYRKVLKVQPEFDRRLRYIVPSAAGKILQLQKKLQDR
ncbi:protein kinase [Acidimicrobium ferrooxidans]|nr:protein kinase [Acidimicrobium ferrooxidans]